MFHSPRSAFFPVLLAALFAPALTHAQDYVFLSKTQQFIRTGANTVVPDPAAPFTFGVSNSKSGLTLTTPTGQTIPLVFDLHDEDYALWGGGATSSADFTQVGGFALPANSRDAALVATLAPGNYTVQVTGSRATGTAQVEVEDMP